MWSSQSKQGCSWNSRKKQPPPGWESKPRLPCAEDKNIKGTRTALHLGLVSLHFQSCSQQRSSSTFCSEGRMNCLVPPQVPGTGNGCRQAAALLWLLPRNKKAQKQPALFHLHLVIWGHSSLWHSLWLSRAFTPS